MKIIFVDRRPEDITCCNLVLSDNMTGGYLAAKHLFELGHKKIAMFGLEPLHLTSSISERHIGFLRAFKEYNIPIPEKTYFTSNYRQENEDVQAEFNLNLTLIDLQTGTEFWQKRVHVGKLVAPSNLM